MKTFIPVCSDEVSSLCDITLIKLLTLTWPSAKENRADIPKLSQGDTSATPTDTSNQAADGAQNKLNVFEMQLCHKDTLAAEDRKSLVTIRKLLLSTIGSHLVGSLEVFQYRYSTWQFFLCSPLVFEMNRNTVFHKNKIKQGRLCSVRNTDLR